MNDILQLERESAQLSEEIERNKAEEQVLDASICALQSEAGMLEEALLVNHSLLSSLARECDSQQSQWDDLQRRSEQDAVRLQELRRALQDARDEYDAAAEEAAILDIEYSELLEVQRCMEKDLLHQRESTGVHKTVACDFTSLKNQESKGTLVPIKELDALLKEVVSLTQRISLRTRPSGAMWYTITSPSRT